MKRISVALLLGGACLSLGFANIKPFVVYGDDNRKDMHQVIDQGILAAADSTVALIDVNRLKNVGQGQFQLETGQYSQDFNLCKGEPFYSQPTAANCSGFLVGEDLVATAGHCISDDECGDYKFVFGFSEKSPGVVETRIDENEIYGCKKIISRELTEEQDYALIKLDRPVRGHQPLRMASRPAAVGDELVVIGHPSGLPTKVADQATVRRQSGRFFVANLDTYGGNSGSAVFNSRSLEVVGILVRGENDFTFDSSGNCTRSYHCGMGDCRGEDATNISFILNTMPQ